MQPLFTIYHVYLGFSLNSFSLNSAFSYVFVSLPAGIPYTMSPHLWETLQVTTEILQKISPQVYSGDYFARSFHWLYRLSDLTATRCIVPWSRILWTYVTLMNNNNNNNNNNSCFNACPWLFKEGMRSPSNTHWHPNEMSSQPFEHCLVSYSRLQALCWWAINNNKGDWQANDHHHRWHKGDRPPVPAVVCRSRTTERKRGLFSKYVYCRLARSTVNYPVSTT